MTVAWFKLSRDPTSELSVAREKLCDDAPPTDLIDNVIDALRKLNLFPMIRAAAVCMLLGGVLAVSRAQWRSLPSALSRRHLTVVPESVQWLDPPGLGRRRAMVIAREGTQPSDVYVVTATTGADDKIIRIEDVSNLTRSPSADEDALVFEQPYAAFATRVAGEIVAFTVVDTRGEQEIEHIDRATRLRGSLTRFQQTGQSRGYAIDRFEFAQPAHAIGLEFTGARLSVTADENAVAVDASNRRILSGETLVRERPRMSSQSDNWVTWAVDTARGLPWIGTAPIAWAEGVAYSARHVARRAQTVVRSADTTQREVAEDLADVLSVHTTDALEGPVVGWPPAPLQSPIQPVIPHEGEWSALGNENDPFVQSNLDAPPPMYITFVRSDRDNDESRSYIVVWDPRQVELHAAPGSQEPMGATGETGSGVIPRDEATISRLIGGFNGAFQGLHGEFGVYAEGALLLPPKPYAATVAALADGSTGFGSWPAEQHEIPPEIVDFRQNLTALIDGGIYNPWHRDDWGPVLNNPADLRTARSGLCLTREGYVAFFWGADLNPRNLADAMLATRCSYGVHLDMNGANTGFDLFRTGLTGTLPRLAHRIEPGFEAEGSVDEVPTMQYRSRRLVRSMQHQASRYIHRNPRDFFYLLLRPVLPGAPLIPPISPAVSGEGTWHVASLTDLPFPWPMARTRVRPDRTQPERWVNLVRIDPRRVTLAPASSPGSVIARVMSATPATSNQLRISMTDGISGAHWSIGTTGTGLAGEPMHAGMETLRGACVDQNGFLVMAVADRALPDLISRALDLAMCEGPKIALQGTVLVLPTGQTVAGESNAARGAPVFALVAREFPMARAIFPEVQPVAREIWHPEQSRRVRYFPNPGNNITVQVRLAGQQPSVFRLPGIGTRFIEQAYPDGGAPPIVPPGN